MKRFKWLIAISLTFVALIPTPAFAATYTDIAGHTDEAYITEYSSYGLVRPDSLVGEKVHVKVYSEKIVIQMELSAQTLLLPELKPLHYWISWNCIPSHRRIAVLQMYFQQTGFIHISTLL